MLPGTNMMLRRQLSSAPRLSRVSVDEHQQQRVRVRAAPYGSGSHGVGGKLLMVPNTADTDLDVVKGLLVMAVYGTATLEELDMANVRLRLLPEGEEITSADLICATDNIGVEVVSLHHVMRRSRAASFGASAHTLMPVDSREDFIDSRAEEGIQPYPRDVVSLPIPEEREVFASPAATPAEQPRKSGLSEGTKKKIRRAVHRLVLLHRFNKASNISKHDSQWSSNTGASVTSRSTWRFKRNRRLARTMDAYVKEQSDLYSYGQQRKVFAQTEEKLPWYIIVPDSLTRMIWDSIILSLVVYSMLTVPVKIGFDAPSDSVEVAFEYLSDCLFICDIALNFFTSYRENGVFVSQANLTAAAYFRSWFFLDLLATFPIHWISDNTAEESSGVGSVNKLLRMLRLFKLFRMLRLVKLFPKLFAVLETNVKLDPALLRFLRSFIVLVFIWHAMGCAYWFVVRWEYGGTVQCPDVADRPPRTCFVNYCLCDADLTRDMTQVTMLNETDPGFFDPDMPNLWLPHPSYANRDVVDQYWFAIFWAVQATTSIGAGISPSTTTESIFTTVMIFIGLMMYSIIIGSASSALSNLDGLAAERRRTLDNILAYMRRREVPRFFQKIIIDYYRHEWDDQAHGGGEILEALPTTLATKLNMIINRDLIHRIPVFQYMTIDSYLKIVQKLRPATYLPGDYIIKQGESGDHMYFIKAGQVDAVLPNGVTVYMMLKPGDFFGEHSLLYAAKRDASFRAVDFVDALILDRADFMEQFISSPDFIAEIQRVDALRQQQRLLFELDITRTARQAQDTSSSTEFCNEGPQAVSSLGERSSSIDGPGLSANSLRSKVLIHNCCRARLGRLFGCCSLHWCCSRASVAALSRKTHPAPDAPLAPAEDKLTPDSLSVDLPPLRIKRPISPRATDSAVTNAPTFLGQLLRTTSNANTNENSAGAPRKRTNVPYRWKQHESEETSWEPTDIHTVVPMQDHTPVVFVGGESDVKASSRLHGYKHLGKEKPGIKEVVVSVAPSLMLSNPASPKLEHPSDSLVVAKYPALGRNSTAASSSR